MSIKASDENTGRLLSDELEECLKTYMADSQSNRPKVSKGWDVGLIVATTVGLGLLAFIAVIIFMLATLPG